MCNVTIVSIIDTCCSADLNLLQCVIFQPLYTKYVKAGKESTKCTKVTVMICITKGISYWLRLECCQRFLFLQIKHAYNKHAYNPCIVCDLYFL